MDFKLKPLAAALMLTASTAMATPTEQTSDLWLEARIATLITTNEYLNPFTIDVDVDQGVAHLSGTVENEVDRELAEILARRVDGVKTVTNGLVIDRDVKRVSDAGTFSRDVKDATITAKVKSRLLWNTHTDGLDIGVSTDNGWVTLDGTVSHNAEAEAARNIARYTDGVRGVLSRITVEESTVDAITSTAKTAADETVETVSDALVEAKVTSAILFDSRFVNSKLDVSAEDGVVTLRGEVESPHQRDALLATVQNVRGVQGVRADVEVR